jgi:hypothetical protein
LLFVRGLGELLAEMLEVLAMDEAFQDSLLPKGARNANY